MNLAAAGKSIFFLVWTAALLAAQPRVQYRLRFPNAIHHQAVIEATFTGVTQPVLQVMMSRSSPGRYALHEFAKNISLVRATDGRGRTLTIARPNPYEWNVGNQDGTVAFEYTLFADRDDGTYSAVDLTHAHLNLPATLVWARGFEQVPADVSIDLPPQLNWTVATQLRANSNGTWSAPNFDRLMDSPLEISAHALEEWDSDGAHFRLALHHTGSDAEAIKFARMCESVVLEEEGVFGAFPKYDEGAYTLLIDQLPYASGDGMEHRDSTVITLPGAGDSATGGISAVSHEFFHSWNVKRIRPRSLEPFNFERVNMSSELWFAEGFTNYYGPLTLQRAGLSALDAFLAAQARALNAVLNSPGRAVSTVIGMSEQAAFVDAAASIDPTDFANTFISYYFYGQALALGIDLQIRQQFPGKSLDDWMRTMWREHPDVNKPYDLSDLQQALAETTSADYARQLFDRHIYAKEPMDYQSLLSYAGFELRPAQPQRLWLGLSKSEFSGQQLKITAPTLEGSPLYEAGIDRGDSVALWDGKAVPGEEELQNWLAAHHSGDRLRLTVQGRTGEREVTITLRQSPELQIVPYEKAGLALTPQMQAFRQAWLSSKALHPLPH